MTEALWFRPLIWMDYRLAVFFLVGMPLVLFVWAFVQRADSVQHLLTIYWRVSSLLAITVYLMIASMPIAFVSSLLARILIPTSLWFWTDLNEEIDDRPGSLKTVFSIWRWAVSAYCLLGTIAIIPFMKCAFVSGATDTPFCMAWLEPTWLYREYFHAGSRPQFLGIIGVIFLILYVLYLAYFVILRLGKQGRSAMIQQD